jgi:methylmalonyl-CoA/ethylmalonyl-CoA epimerase
MAGIHVNKLVQVAVPVEDPARAKAFYADMLGLKHLFDAPPGLSFFQCGETRLMLSRPEGPETAGSSILYYGVEDAQVACAALAERGVAVEEGARLIARVEGKDLWLAIVRDSEGNLLGLMSEQAPASATPATSG